MVFHAFDEPVSLAENLAARVANQIAGRLEVAESAFLAVSGGSTPEKFLKRLSTAIIDWSRVTVVLVDERCVPPSSPRSNMGLVTRLLLQDRAASARLLPLFDGMSSVDESERQANEAIAAFGRLDACVLGMGLDGHTASLFPGGDRLAEALDLGGGKHVLAIRAPGAEEPRLTLTLPALLNSRLLALHIEGEDKKAVFDNARAPGRVSDMPVRAVIGEARDRLEVYWAP
jgi:6-phosphogluconolactonase